MTNGAGGVLIWTTIGITTWLFTLFPLQMTIILLVLLLWWAFS